jgi:hypothetical protein
MGTKLDKPAIARYHLYMALALSIPSDNQTIMDHVRRAYAQLGGDVSRFERHPYAGVGKVEGSEAVGQVDASPRGVL